MIIDPSNDKQWPDSPTWRDRLIRQYQDFMPQEWWQELEDRGDCDREYEDKYCD